MTNSKRYQNFMFGEVSRRLYSLVEVVDINCFLIIDDYYGQLGVGNQRCIHSLPKVCSFNILVKQVSCGDEHTVFVSGDGGFVYAMGNNQDGKLGIGNS